METSSISTENNKTEDNEQNKMQVVIQTYRKVISKGKRPLEYLISNLMFC